MRFWKFIKDELRKNQNQQELQNNSSENQEMSDIQSQQSDNQEQLSQSQNNSSEQGQESSQQASDSQRSEEQEMSGSQSDSSNNESNSSNSKSFEEEIDNGKSEQQDSNNSQNDQLNGNQSNSNESNNNESNLSEEQEMSDNQSQQGDNQEQQNQPQSSSSEQGQESSQQASDSQQSEGQEMSDSQSQQGDNQEQQNQSQGSSSEQVSSQKDEEKQLNNSSQEQDAGKNDTSVSPDEIEDIQEEIEVPSEEEIEQKSDEIANNPKLTNEQKRELLEKLKKSIEEIRKRKAEKLQREHINHEKKEIEESKEEKYELSQQTNNFLNQLGELPSFEDRDRGAGYSIDTESYTEVPESIIRTLITKFLNQRFCKHNTDLNIRSNSLEKTNGFYKWEVNDVITHLQTHQVTKVLTDKYGYEYANGKNENVPLSFYFDMSGSMSSYTNMLAVIAIELLKKGVKVLIGFNERVNVQIENIEKNITVLELADILESAGYWNGWGSSGRDGYKKDPRVKFKYIERNIDNYLIEKKAEKCVVFSDFDPLSEVINLSQAADVYWFCFESRYDSYDIDDFNGFIYKVQNIKDLEQGLLKVNEKRFETLCYTDNPKSLQKKVRVKR